jgi:hypothetical protein
MSSYKTYTAAEIVAIFKANPNAIDLNLENVRTNKANTCTYFKLRIADTDGKLYIPKIKFFKQKVIFKTMAPEERKYEGTALTINRDSTDGEDSSFGEAIDILSTAFVKKMKDSVASHSISDDAGDDDNTESTVIIPSVKATVPITRFRMVDGKREDLKNPIIKIPMATKRLTPQEETELPLLPGALFKQKPFAFTIFDTSKVTNGRPMTASVDGQSVDTLNVHEFITRGSIINGQVALDVCSSKAGTSMKLAIDRALYVTPAAAYQPKEIMDDDDFAMMGLGTQAPAPKVPEPAGAEEPAEDEEDELVDPAMADIDNLTL